MHRFALSVLIVAVPLTGCSSGGGMSTSSILGGAPTPPAATAGTAPAGAVAIPVAAVPSSTPTDRAFLVGSVSARASKCGYNFDPAKLKASYIANEMSRGTPGDQVATLEQAYTVAFNGVSKAAAEDPNYCSDRKTQDIKADLNRLLAGDFEPRKVAQKDDGGVFGDFFSSGSPDNGPKFGSNGWWDKQAEKAGK